MMRAACRRMFTFALAEPKNVGAPLRVPLAAGMNCSRPLAEALPELWIWALSPGVKTVLVVVKP